MLQHYQARLSLVAALLFLVAFTRQDDPKQRIARTWKFAEASVLANLEEVVANAKQREPDNADQIEASRPAVEATLRAARLTFKADGTYLSITPGQPDQIGTWTLSADGKTLTRITPVRTATNEVLTLTATELVLKREGRSNNAFVPAE